MQTKAIFRGLLILQVFTVIAGILAGHLGLRSLPLDLQDYVNSQGAQLMSDHRTAFTIFKVGYSLSLLLFTISLVGLFLLWSPARVLYCIFVVGGSLLNLLTNSIHIVPMWAALWKGWDGILTGIILCMIFTSPIREQFAKTHKTPPNEAHNTDA
jgi:hypothetical protein